MRDFISYHAHDDIYIDSNVDLNDVRKIVDNTGMYGKIYYDPFTIFDVQGRRILGRVRNSLVTARDISVRELEKLVLSIWESLEVNALWGALKIAMITDNKVTAGELVDHYLPGIVRLVLQKLDIRRVEIYPQLLENKHFVHFSVGDFKGKISKFAEAAILRYLFDGKTRGQLPDLPDVYTI